MELAEQHPRDIDVLLLAGRLHLDAAAMLGFRPSGPPRRAAAGGRRVEPNCRAFDRTTRAWPYRLRKRVGGRRECPIDRAPHNRLRRGVAEWFAEMPLVATAENHYREAIRRSPETPDYHEFLGEFLHAVGRPDEAIETWSRIASDENAAAQSLIRLAGLLRDYGHIEPALDAAQRAAERDADRFEFREVYARLLTESANYDAAMEQLDQLDRLAANTNQHETAMRMRIDTYVRADAIDSAIRDLRVRISGKQPADVDKPADDSVIRDLRLLARLYSVNNEPSSAADALRRCVELSPDDNRLIREYAELLIRNRNPAAAIKQYERLLERDSAGRDGLLEKIVQLELDRNNRRGAVDAGKPVA